MDFPPRVQVQNCAHSGLCKQFCACAIDGKDKQYVNLLMHRSLLLDDIIYNTDKISDLRLRELCVSSELLTLSSHFLIYKR